MVMPIMWGEVLARIFEEVGVQAVLRIVVEYARRQEDKYENVDNSKYVYWRKIRHSTVELIEDCFLKEAEVISLNTEEEENGE